MITRSLKLVSEPPAGTVLNVGMHDFAYLTPSMPQKYLETVGLAYCRGVYLHSKELRVLAHCPEYEYDNGPMSSMLQYLQDNRLLRGRFDRGVVVISGDVARDYSDATHMPPVLQKVCNKIDFVVGSDKGKNAHVIFDRKGRVYSLNYYTVKTPASTELHMIPKSSGNVLVCGTNGDLVPITDKEFIPQENGFIPAVKRLFRD